MTRGLPATRRSYNGQSIMPSLSNYTAKTASASTGSYEEIGLCPGFKETEKTA
jgi:hypothetical protein